MICAWKEFFSILPTPLRREIDHSGREELQELRLRLGQSPELVFPCGSKRLTHSTPREDLMQCINNASRYSPWNAATAANGYLTASGGHRIGICGEAIIKDGIMTGFREITSICIRIARDFPGIAPPPAEISGSALILGAPGWGKTTLLRDLIRQLSDCGCHVGVVDERGEVFPELGCFPRGRSTDVLTGCGKAQGINTLLRTMGPDCIAVDEITAPEDCNALLHAAFCGVRLLATAHAGDLRDFTRRPVYRPLLEANIFQTVLVLKPDKTYQIERMAL